MHDGRQHTCCSCLMSTLQSTALRGQEAGRVRDDGYGIRGTNPWPYVRLDPTSLHNSLPEDHASLLAVADHAEGTAYHGTSATDVTASHIQIYSSRTPRQVTVFVFFFCCKLSLVSPYVELRETRIMTSHKQSPQPRASTKALLSVLHSAPQSFLTTYAYHLPYPAAASQVRKRAESGGGTDFPCIAVLHTAKVLYHSPVA